MYYMATTVLAVILGIFLVITIHPGVVGQEKVGHSYRGVVGQEKVGHSYSIEGWWVRRR